MPWIFQLLIGLVLNIAGTLIASMSKQDQKQKVPGVRGTLQSGGDLSPRFIVGRYGTGGQLRYAGYWGNAGDVPNAYYSKVIEVSCLPIRGFSGFFVNGERVTLGGAKTGTLGYPVLEYRAGGVDHLWINPYLGNQTTEDPLMLAQFGAHPDRPYAGMIGRGCGMFVATALVNRELFTSLPEYLAEVDGIVLDDPRGDGQHDNPIVAIYTLLKGLTYGGEWVYGPQGMTNANFRAANLESEADKCDVPRVLAGGGTEKRYRIGLDIALEEEPHAVVGELLKGCAGRWADLGGVYRFLVGGPSEAVVSFNDEDIVTSQQQTFEPFPGLENLFNAMNATYPEPAESWELKEAPPRYRSDLEVLDDNRRLPFSTQYKAVPWAVQVQELMRAAIEEVRRFRKHTHTMPPEWWEYEPLDVAAWTSTRNGYVGKDFLITTMDDLPNANQFVGLQEMDASDYAWSSEFQLPYDLAPLVIARPAPQPIIGFAVEPYTGVDNEGNPRRPGFRIYGYGSGLVDVQEVWVQSRLAGGVGLILDGRAPYDPAELDPSLQWSGDPLLPATAYEVRGKLVPFSGRPTEWSAWLPVTTEDVRLGLDDVAIDLSNVAKDVLAQMGAKPRYLVEMFKKLGTLLEEADREAYTKRETLYREISVELEGLEASFTEIIEVALGPGGAIAQALESLYAAMGGNTAEVNIRWSAVAAPDGYSARYAIQAAVNDGSFRAATLFLDVPSDPAQPTRIGLMAGQTAFLSSAGSPIAIISDDGVMRAGNNSWQLNMNTGDMIMTRGSIQSSDSKFQISPNLKRISIST